MTRTVADLTDDEIVDAVAGFGVRGALCQYGGDDAVLLLIRLKADLGGAHELYRRCNALTYHRPPRLLDEGRVMLSPTEWGKRLANRSAEDIARMLAGEA